MHFCCTAGPSKHRTTDKAHKATTKRSSHETEGTRHSPAPLSEAVLTPSWKAVVRFADASVSVAAVGEELEWRPETKLPGPLQSAETEVQAKAAVQETGLSKQASCPFISCLAAFGEHLDLTPLCFTEASRFDCQFCAAAAGSSQGRKAGAEIPQRSTGAAKVKFLRLSSRKRPERTKARGLTMQPAGRLLPLLEASFLKMTILFTSGSGMTCR